MKKTISASSYLLVAIAAGFLTLYLSQRWGREDPCPPDGMVLIQQSFIDSLREVANRPPDTMVVVKTVYGDSVQVNHGVPLPVYEDPEENMRIYEDSIELIEDGIDAWVKIKARGFVEQIVWGYRPVYRTTTRTVTIAKPYPVEYYQVRPQRGLFVTGGLGVGPSQVGFSLGLEWLQCNGLSYGVEVLQFDQRFYMAKVGYKIF